MEPTASRLGRALRWAGAFPRRPGSRLSWHFKCVSQWRRPHLQSSGAKVKIRISDTDGKGRLARLRWVLTEGRLGSLVGLVERGVISHAGQNK